jgi:hypothetical protein
MQAMMQAAVARAFDKPLAADDLPFPTQGPGEILGL